MNNPMEHIEVYKSENGWIARCKNFVFIALLTACSKVIEYLQKFVDMQIQYDENNNIFPHSKHYIQYREPTPKEIFNACMYFRHDYGLLPPEKQEEVKWQAKEWLYSWHKAGRG